MSKYPTYAPGTELRIKSSGNVGYVKADDGYSDVYLYKDPDFEFRIGWVLKSDLEVCGTPTSADSMLDAAVRRIVTDSAVAGSTTLPELRLDSRKAAKGKVNIKVIWADKPETAFRLNADHLNAIWDSGLVRPITDRMRTMAASTDLWTRVCYANYGPGIYIPTQDADRGIRIAQALIRLPLEYTLPVPAPSRLELGRITRDQWDSIPLGTLIRLQFADDPSEKRIIKVAAAKSDRIEGFDLAYGRPPTGAAFESQYRSFLHSKIEGSIDVLANAKDAA